MKLQRRGRKRCCEKQASDEMRASFNPARKPQQVDVFEGVKRGLQRAQESFAACVCSLWQPQGRQGRLAALGCISYTGVQNQKSGKQRKTPRARLHEVIGNIAEAAAKRKDPKDKAASHAETDDRILISEVEVRGVDGDLKRIAEGCIAIRPNFSYSLLEVKENANKVFSSGYFERLEPSTEDTRDGVKLIFNVTANKELQGVVVTGANLLPASLIEETFEGQYGATLNFGRFGRSLELLNKWYEDRAIVGQVSHVGLNGNVAEVQVSEMRINNINLRFEDRNTGDIKEEGKTKPEVVLRQLLSQPGQVYNRRRAKEDIEAVYSMGLFHDVNIIPQVCEDSTALDPTVDLNLNLIERKTGGLSGGGGISATGTSEGALPGFIGSLAYSQRNLFGLNQKLALSVEIGQLDKVFRINHTDPWVRGDPYRTSRTTSLQNMRTSGNPVHGRAPDDVQKDSSGQGSEGNVIIAKTTGGVEYGRPLATGWTGTAGMNWQRSKCLDDQGRVITEDAYRSPLTFSGGKSDTMMVALLRAVYTGPQDTQLVTSMEQAVPFVQNWLNMNRFHGRAERTFSTPLAPLKLRLCGKGGMIFGDMPPYEAFPLGGTNSVRGYAEGAVGSARNFVTGTAEIRWPLFGPFEGTAFGDYGSDLDSGQTILGDPAGVRGKPGSGYGYGAGIRLDSSLGTFRFEYAFNDKGLRRFHLGIGSHG